jgi:YihY family inner membrane protein
MDSTPDLPGNQSLDSTAPASGVKRRNILTRRNAALTLWIIGLIALVVASVIVRSHPGPWPFDLQTTINLQQLQLPPWVITPIVWASFVNNPYPTAVNYIAWFVGLSLIGVVAWRKGKSPIPWFVTAIFLSIGIAVMDGLDGIIGFIANRPRPASPLMHIYMPEPGIASFPSGHVESVVVYYGFLLYLSLSKPISRWRFRWVLIPFQVYAALNILSIGYSRVYEGSHWLTDALGGYFAGAVWLVLLIVLYRWTLDRMTRWYARRSALATQAHQTAGETMHEKSLEAVQVVEKKAFPYEELFIKCKEDWIHHLAQALAFSFLTALVPIAIILLPIVSVIQGKFDTQTQRLLAGSLEELIPPPISSPVTQVFGKAFDSFLHASPIAIVFTFLLAVLFGSFLFSLMALCFNVIYHLPPRRFLHRHIVAIGMLFLFVALSPIIILASAAPTFIFSLGNVVPPGGISDSSLISRLLSIAGSTILSLILFQAIYVLVPHRHIRFQTLGRHIRNSWYGTLVSTVALQLGLFLFPIYATLFATSYIGQAGFVILMLLYFYLFALILLFGAEVNAFFAEGIRVPQNDLITQASRDEFR